MEDDNVIYVQVDEQGRVINYTSNNAIGDQLILLQEDGQNAQAGTSVQQSVSVTQTAVSPTLISQPPVLLSQPTIQPVGQPAAQSSSQPAKPTIINLASLPSGLTLVGATKPISQAAGGVRIAPKTGTQGPLSPVRTTTVQQLPTSSRINLSPDRMTFNPKTITISPQKVTSPQDGPQKVTLNPQTITLSQQNMKLSPHKIGNVSVIARPSVGQIRVTPPGKSIIGTQSIITPSGMKQVSLLGPVQNKITIKGSPAMETLSLDQLVSSGGVTLQRISSSTQSAGLSSTQGVSGVNSTTGNDAIIGSPEAAVRVISDALTSQDSIPDDVMASHEGVSYAKPDTTTDETSLLNYQVSESHVTTADNVGLATDTISRGAQELMTSSGACGVGYNVMMSDTVDTHEALVINKTKVAAKIQGAVDEETVSSDEKQRDPVEILDETLEEYLAGDSDVISDENSAKVVQVESSNDEPSSMDVSYSAEERAEKSGLVDKSENEAASQSEDEFDDDLPAGLIRGEPVFIPPENYKSTHDELISDNEKETGNDIEIVPAEITSVTPRKSRLPLTTQGEPSDTESVPMPTEEEEFEIDIKEQLTSTQSSATKVHSRKTSQKSNTSAQEAPEESGKKDFMKKNFNLFTPREIEEQKSKRRSARISIAEQQQQVEAELEKEEQLKQQSSSATAETDNKDTSGGSANNDTSGTLRQQNVFDIFGMKDESPSDDPKKYITKLQSVNTELKGRIRQLEQKYMKSPTTKYKEKMQMKQLQNRLERMERLNEELAGRLQEYEGKTESPPERRVDMTYKHGKFSFSTPVSTFRKEVPRMDTTPSTSQQKRDLSLLAKNEQKVRALHNELDQRTAMLKARESRINRLVVEIKERENKVVYREQALLRRVQDIEYRERILEGKTKAAIEKRNKQGGGAPPESDDIRSKELIRFEMEQRERDLKRRENEIAKRRQEAENKEELLKVTERQLQELHTELKHEYEHKHNKQDVEDLFGTPTSTYLSHVGATPISGRSGRLRKSIGSGLTMTGSDGKSAEAGTSAEKRRSRTDLPEETPVRRSRRDNVSRESSVDSKQESIKSTRQQQQQQQSEGNSRTSRQTPRRGKAADQSETDSKAEEDTPVTAKSRKTPKRDESADDSKDGGASDKAPTSETTERRGRSRRSGVEENKSTPVSEKSRKTPRRGETELQSNENDQAPSSESTERRGRSRKSTTETPKTMEQNSDAKRTPKAGGKSLHDVVATLSKRQQEQDQTTAAVAEPEEVETTKVKDEFDFESESHQSETSSVDGGEIKDRAARSKKRLTATKVRDLRQPLKGTKRSRDGSGHVAVLRKRSRSHSASPAPSDVKRKKE